MRRRSNWLNHGEGYFTFVRYRDRAIASLAGNVALLVAASLSPVAVQAQTPPDAGSVRRQIEQQQRPALPPAAAEPLAPPAPMQSLGGDTITVTQFRFAGNSLLTTEQLLAAVAGYTGHPIDFSQLQNAAIAVANAYRQAGWIVRAYLPAQEITDGIVTIQVIEAKLGAVRIETPSKRMASRRFERMVNAAQKPDAPIRTAALDRALLLIDDLPGITATGRLSAGERPGQTDLSLDVRDGAPITGNVVLDNMGSRFTGEARAVLDAGLNNRLGIGDRAAALLLHSDGNDYLQLEYSMPLGSRGLRAGLNGSQLAYEIVSKEFDALDAHGDSTSYGFDASYPLLRSRFRNLYAIFDAGESRFDNRSVGQTTTHYDVQSATLGLHGNLFDEIHGGGASSASLELVVGKVDLSGSPNELSDAQTTRTAGSFRKLQLAASRLQHVSERFALFASVRGQLANKNLDSSQRLYLGGSQTVRAYPQDEAGGADGVLLNLEGRTHLPAGFNLTGFVDWGKVRVNHDNDFAGALQRNDIVLKGAGLAVDWTAGFGLTIRATAARRIGSNPSPTSAGTDHDGSLTENRIWLQASLPL